MARLYEHVEQVLAKSIFRSDAWRLLDGPYSPIVQSRASRSKRNEHIARHTHKAVQSKRGAPAARDDQEGCTPLATGYWPRREFRIFLAVASDQWPRLSALAQMTTEVTPPIYLDYAATTR